MIYNPRPTPYNLDRVIYFDYQMQVWVKDRLVVNCGHPKDMDGGNCCNQRKYAGLPITEARRLEGLES